VTITLAHNKLATIRSESNAGVKLAAVSLTVLALAISFLFGLVTRRLIVIAVVVRDRISLLDVVPQDNVTFSARNS